VRRYVGESLVYGEDTEWRNGFTPMFYYEQTRKEIEREDNITDQRLSWAVSMQSFLMAADGFLACMAARNREFAHYRISRDTLAAVGMIGFFAAYITLGGVRASRMHVERVKEDWMKYSRREIVPEMAPHTFEHGPTIVFGRKYAVMIPVLMLMLLAWAIYLLAYTIVLGPQLWGNLWSLAIHYPKAF
jgi:hypothetical protein